MGILMRGMSRVCSQKCKEVGKQVGKGRGNFTKVQFLSF